jgi:hypothetical protein
MSDQVKQEGQEAEDAGVISMQQAEDVSTAKSGGLMSYVGNLAAPILTSLVVSSVVATMAIVVNDKTRKPEFAVIDLAGIVELEQLRLTASVMKPGTSDDEKLKAFQRVQAFGGVLEKAIEELKADCQCVLMARNAFIGVGGVDYTETLKRKVGLAGVDIESIKKLTEMAVSRAIPSAESVRPIGGAQGTLLPGVKSP